jgi:uncharacterized small protein (DUF1192 family)
MKKTELETLEKGLTQTVTEYNNIPLTDADKGKTLSILEKETKIISGENKSIFDEELSTKRFELEKDKVYSSQKLDDKKFDQDVKQKAFDNNIKTEELNLTKEKFDQDVKQKAFDNNIKTEELNLTKEKFDQDVKNQEFENSIKQQELELSKLKMENDRKMALIQEQSRKNEQIFRYVSLGVTAVTTLTGIIVPLIVYSRLAKTNLYHIYKQEGRSTKEFDEAIRNVKSLIRK